MLPELSFLLALPLQLVLLPGEHLLLCLQRTLLPRQAAFCGEGLLFLHLGLAALLEFALLLLLL